MIEKFKSILRDYKISKTDPPLLVGVSGGVDSMVLCDLLKRCDYRFVLAHCNYKLRNEDSEKDSLFVEEYAKKNGISFHITEFETRKIANNTKSSLQTVARELRYDWFRKLRSDHKYGKITTAHHLNDNIETVFLNIIRGTGIHGISGMKILNDDLFRPMLDFTRDEIMKYADDCNIAFREDKSNEEVYYDRNYLRQKVIPVLKQMQPSFEKVMARNIQNWKEIEMVYNRQISSLSKKFTENRGSDIYIHLKKLSDLGFGITLLHELVKEFGFSKTQLSDIFYANQTGAAVFSKTHRIIRNRNFLIVTEVDKIDETIQFVNEKDSRLICHGLNIKLETIEDKHRLDKSGKVLQLDKDKLVFPLVFRPWKRGDYFYPLGMKKRSNPEKIGKKKVSDYFIDKKVALPEKEKAIVVLSQERICGIFPHEIDDRFKIKENTKNIYRITLIE